MSIMKVWKFCWVLPLFLLLACSDGSAVTSPTLSFTPEPAAQVVTILEDTKGTPVPTAAPAPTPGPTPVSTGPQPEVFSVIWVSDTQHYSELYPEMLLSMTQWTAQQRQARNIKAFVHTGDMVNRSGSSRQWDNIAVALDALGDLPLLALAGNHDVGTTTLDYSYFLEHVASRYPHTDQLFEKGRGSWLELSMEYQSFLLIGTGWGYKEESVAWLNDVIRAHPLDIVILCAHSYLDTNGSFTDGGDILFEHVVKPNHNVKLVLSGHRDDVALRTDEMDDNGDGVIDRKVYAMLYNYQEVKANGGGGYVRILTVDPGKRTVQVETYSPYLDAYKTGEKEAFVLNDLF